MSKGNTTENDVVKFMFNSTAMPAYGGNLYLALHTGDPTESGDQTSSEATYGNYQRVAVPRDNTGTGWLVVDNQADNKALIQFAQSSAVNCPQTITHLSIGIAASGASQILYSGALDTPLVVNNLVQPQFAISAIAIQED